MSDRKFIIHKQNEIIKGLEDPVQACILHSKKKYMCSTHPEKPAFCMCAKCGALLCENCSLIISGRRFCENCMASDDALIDAFEKELIRPKIRPNEDCICETPKSIADIPRAIINMVKDSSIFFKTAKDAPFGLTYALAVLALAPNNIYCMLFKLDEIIPPQGDTAAYNEIIKAQPPEICISSALFATIVQILLLDLILFGCIKIFTHAKVTFTETGSTLHFCLLPLFFSVLATHFDLPLIAVFAQLCMIIEATTATRIISKSSAFQGIGMMLTFIFVTSLLKLL